MVRCLAILFTALLMALPVRGQTDFDGAVAAYRAGDSASAEVLFQGLLQGGLNARDEGILQYNLGNIAFRGERFGEAVARYSASVAAWPKSADAWHNLELARSKAGLDAADGGDLVATIKRIGSLPSDGGLVLVAWCLVGLVGLCLGGEVYFGGSLLRVGAGLGLVLLAGDLVWMQGRAWDSVEQPASVVQMGGAELFSEPRSDLGLGQILDLAERVEVLDRLGKPGANGSWVKVRAGEQLGWLPEGQILVW